MHLEEAFLEGKRLRSLRPGSDVSAGLLPFYVSTDNIIVYFFRADYFSEYYIWPYPVIKLENAFVHSDYRGEDCWETLVDSLKLDSTVTFNITDSEYKPIYSGKFKVIGSEIENNISDFTCFNIIIGEL